MTQCVDEGERDTAPQMGRGGVSESVVSGAGAYFEIQAFSNATMPPPV